MSFDLHQLADLVDARDRHALNQGFVRLVQAHLGVASVTLARIVGEADERRWLVCAYAKVGEAVDLDDPAWRDWRHLPAFEARPFWTLCLESDSPVRGLEGINHVFYARIDLESPGVLEVCAPTPFAQLAERVVLGLLTVFLKIHGLLDYSQRDSLTGLLNRKSFDESFYKASALPSPKGIHGLPDRREFDGPLYWLGVVDVDHFKMVNDRFGHLIGDEVLLLLARVMRGCLRQVDRLYRFGGEEFVVLLRCSCEADALATFERLAEAVRRCRFPQVEKITISIGFTDVRTGDTASASVERADQSVYIAKSSGRDRVISHAAMLREGRIQETASVGDIELFG